MAAGASAVSAARPAFDAAAATSTSALGIVAASVFESAKASIGMPASGPRLSDVANATNATIGEAASKVIAKAGDGLIEAGTQLQSFASSAVAASTPLAASRADASASAVALASAPASASRPGWRRASYKRHAR
ncbi:hypothetical protein [Pararobbsia silviterrae]|uniref:Uncharacterized protein n=1 Tax=Pararobbsia silviterrae TaxID=1792498 RepID=A0A494XNG4_9BURK|nr:hypothetical protein [Pararobbsia silviterrae]RKP50266.1 hypothetical protein D7S86_19305 [Pararobbsia silviterrae]